MTLDPGRSLGPYEIVEPLGAGGMGEVYRARDTRLDRDVAIKVLPAALAGNEQIRARFEREAKTISQLNHPNICTLHDVGSIDGIEFLVMEYIEGSSLSQILEKGPLPLDRALRYGIQIAEALSLAHRQGVIHRDLKPGNVMITASGAKLLDFGLAKIAQQANERGDSIVDLPTQQRDLTEEGTILGTVQYMAPEQLEGQEADARTDIFAFGMLLFEMITGQRAFTGKSRVSLIAAIMEHQPPSLTSLQPLSPPALDRLIRICLAKDPDDRWQTAHDIELQLRWVEEGGTEVGLPVMVAAHKKKRERLSWIVAAAAILVAIVFSLLWFREAKEPVRMVRTTILPAANTVLKPGRGIAISPDGSTVALVADDETGMSRIYLRRLGDIEPHPLMGTERAFHPFWSWDGREIGFFVEDQKLKKISATGGPAQTLCDALGPRGGTWGPDGTIVYNGAGGHLYAIPSAGGSPRELTTLDESKGEVSDRWPSFLPDGEHVLFVAQTGPGTDSDDQSTIDVVSIQSRERKTLFNANSTVTYSPSGHILFWREGSLMAQSFDAKSLEVTGDPVPIVERVFYSNVEFAGFSISREGTLAYQTGAVRRDLSRLAWSDREGTSLEYVGEPADMEGTTLSHDGTRVAYSLDEDIWVRDLIRGTVSRLTFESGPQFAPIWSPDDQWIAYSSSGSGPRSIYRKRSSGIGQVELLLQPEAFARPWDWSPDGKTLVYSYGTRQEWDFGTLSLEDGHHEPLLETPFQKVQARFSPDGRWLLFQAGDVGTFEIYVYQLFGNGGKWQISNSGGIRPTWSRDGSEIIYRDGEKLMVVDVELGDTFRAGIPRVLTELPGTNWRTEYNVTTDGSRVLWNIRHEDPADEEVEPLTLVLNWTELLREPR